MFITFKQTKIWMMISNNIHVWLGQGKLAYWQFILNRILTHYNEETTDFQRRSDSKKEVIVMIDGYPGGQGGLTDRLRGALSIYSLCKKCHWNFKYYFNYPFDLQEYLIPNAYNWSIQTKDIHRSTKTAKPLALYLMNFPWEGWLDQYLLKREINNSHFQQYHIYTNAFFDKADYSDLFKELFRPSEILQHEIDRNKQLIGSKYISVTFRFQELLGDLKEASECKVLPPADQKQLINKCLEQLKIFIAKKLPSQYKVLVMADSFTFLEEAKKLERVYIIPGKIFHPHYSANGEMPFLKSFIDFYLLMEAEEVHLFRTGLMYKSGFPEFAALLGGKKFHYTEF